jgi:hypothetical protein
MAKSLTEITLDKIKAEWRQRWERELLEALNAAMEKAAAEPVVLNYRAGLAAGLARAIEIVKGTPIPMPKVDVRCPDCGEPPEIRGHEENVEDPDVQGDPCTHPCHDKVSDAQG